MQKSLSYSKGITTSPSGMLADDTELVESVGMVYKAGEMHPIQKAKKIAELTEPLIFVHKGPNYDMLITYNDGSEHEGKSWIHWYKRNDAGEITGDGVVSIGPNVLSVNSMGNTLVLATDKGLYYLLLKGEEYVLLGSDLPRPVVKFQTVHEGNTFSLLTKKPQACYLLGFVDVKNVNAGYDKDGNFVEEPVASTVFPYSTDMVEFKVKDDKVDDFQTAVSGHVALIQNLVKEKNCFLYPFFVRYALRLFDGSYARISAPIAVYPSVTRNGYLTSVVWYKGGFQYDRGANKRFLYLADMFSLYYKVVIPGIEDWKDIVKEVVVFATDDVMPFQIDKDYQFVEPANSNGFQYLNYVGSRYPNLSTDRADITTTINFNYHSLYARYIILPKEFKTKQEIIDELLSRTQFYKLFTVDVNGIKQDKLLEAPIKNNVVTNLTQQMQLPNDDYYGWTSMIAGEVYSYNKRINAFKVKRVPFKGFTGFTTYPSKVLTYGRYKFYVHVVSDTMDAWVESGSTNEIVDVLDSWFYYPDPNATEAIIWDCDNNKGHLLTLKRHDMLNGAYSFYRLPLYDNFIADDTVTVPKVDANAYEDLSSQIFTSVVNNPFVFEASGDNTVGTGSIQGIAANTEPISQGQFGQYPLIVFTTEGIYGMSVNAEGLYASSYPISREVCNNAASITPTGKLVFFTSAKGLMAVSGGTVACMSEQLRGRNPSRFVTLGDGNFLGFLDNALLAYDYRDSLLHILNTKESYEYVYSIADRTFAKKKLGGNVIAVANAYPDNLVQLADGSVLSLASKPNINMDEERYEGTFTTRPLKLGSSLQLKTIHRILHLFDSEDGTIALRLYGSNDCRNWCELKSLHGKPWKYYTLSYELGNMLATDAFAGTVVDFQALFPDKIR